MVAEIKSLHSPDVYDLVNFSPEDYKPFGFLLELTVGSRGAEGGEIFSVTVCNPQWFLEKYREDDVLFISNYILLIEYDYDRLLSALKKRIESLSSDNWSDLALKISKIGNWEFESYREI